MARFAPSLLLSVSLSLSVLRCGAAEPSHARHQTTSDDPAAETAFKAARDLFEQGRLDEADAGFEAFARTFPRDPLYGGAVVFRARIAVAEGDAARALGLCAGLASRDVDPTTRERCRLYEGIAAAAVGEHERAVRLLTPFLGSLTDASESRLLLSSLWRSAAALGDTRRALGWLDAFLAGGPPAGDAAAARAALDDLLARATGAEALSEIAASLDPKGAVWPRVMGRIARLRYDAGDLEAAAGVLADIGDKGRRADAGVDDVAVLVEKRTRVDLAAIGCILPLSGRARAVGEAALRGVMLGARETRLPDGRPFSIIVRDTEGDPARAAAMVDQLAVESGVAGLIGPLDGAEAEAVAKRAGELGLPVVLLAPKGDLRAGQALRVFPSSRAEVEALVDAAVAAGAAVHAILHPDNASGAALRDLYAAALARRGLAAGAIVPYPDGTTDFTPFARQLASRGIDAVFLPDTAARVALGAPALAAAGVIGVARAGGPSSKPGGFLVATSAGFSPDLVRRAGRYLQRSLFAAHFAAGATPSATEFAHRYGNEYGGEPSHYATYGHDAAVLLEWAISHGAASRTAIAAALRGATADSTAAAPLAGRFAGFGPDGSPLAPPFVLALEGEEWKVVR